ncbi:acyl-CoA dehydrogenase family protein [Pseudonocardia acaciae]|uniref:acyl-CoA dehydrogenase family protein n=1 Tax=Pseudonocardia acaciae TaxID=551276 RepID=UPI00048B90F7|nr:acyl-CoA dehydrogenase family protein [Pseudonocardia acaciae]
MDVTLSAEQRDLRTVLRAALDRQDPEPWKLLSGDLGLTGLTVPERYGGAGGSFVDLAVVLAELGRSLCPVPYLQTAVAATVLADAGGLAADVLPALAEGTLVAGVAVPDSAPTAVPGEAGLRLTGTLTHVVDGPALDLLLTPADLDGTPVLAAVRLLPGAGVTVRPEQTLDRTRPQATIRLDAAPAVRLDGDPARAEDLLLAAVAVESAGAARHCLDTTVDYLRTREQFGRPIGGFQALQHRCADLAVAVESAWSTAWYAAWAADADTSELRTAAPLSKLYCAKVFRLVTGEMIQMHGGIGFTWEHPAHRYFKRATATELLFGGRRRLRERLAAQAGLRP